MILQDRPLRDCVNLVCAKCGKSVRVALCHNSSDAEILADVYRREIELHDLTCPHCGHNYVEFTSVECWHIADFGNSQDPVIASSSKEDAQGDKTSLLVFECDMCDNDTPCTYTTDVESARPELCPRRGGCGEAEEAKWRLVGTKEVDV